MQPWITATPANVVGGTGDKPETPRVSGNSNSVGNALESKELGAGEFEHCTGTPEKTQTFRLKALDLNQILFTIIVIMGESGKIVG